jgi:co-chaperonin GroES (HSP10)
MPNAILPWSDIIIVTEPPEDVTENGVLIGNAPSAEEKARTPEKGVVVAIGKNSDTKHKFPIALKPGDLIFYERYTANKIPYQGKEYNFIRTKFIMGAIQQ